MLYAMLATCAALGPRINHDRHRTHIPQERTPQMTRSMGQRLKKILLPATLALLGGHWGTGWVLSPCYGAGSQYRV